MFNLFFRIIGLNAMNRYDLRVRTEGYSTEYDPTCNPSIFNEFATAAFRYIIQYSSEIPRGRGLQHLPLASNCLIQEPRYFSDVIVAICNAWFFNLHVCI